MISVSFQRLAGFDAELPLPAYETAGAAGMDLRANFEDRAARILPVGKRVLVPLGLSMAMPDGFEAQIRPRSGLALKHGVTLVNTPGTIDADYRGPLGVILINHGTEDFEIDHGARIAQMVIAPIVQVQVELRDNLPDTDRGAGGFGSTGTS